MNAEDSLDLSDIRDVADVQIGKNELESSKRHALISEFDVELIELVVIKACYVEEVADIIDCDNRSFG